MTNHQMTQFQKYEQFRKAMGIPKFPLTEYKLVTDEVLDLAHRLITEEVIKELLVAIDQFKHSRDMKHLVKILDGAVDSAYVIFQACAMLSLPFDEAFNIVHGANMAKVGPDGVVRYNEYGKVMKPEGWQSPEPQLRKLLEKLAGEK